MYDKLLLTPIQSFYAMELFLEDYFRHTSSDSIGALLSCMQFLNDGQTADPALWEDWCEIVGHEPINYMQAFQSMRVFLNQYYQATSSTNVKNMLNDISLVIHNISGKDMIWQKWLSSIDRALE
jgi:hypothetical protein